MHFEFPAGGSLRDRKTILLLSCSPLTSAVTASSLSLERTGCKPFNCLDRALFHRLVLSQVFTWPVLFRSTVPNKQRLFFSSDFWFLCLPLFPGRRSIALQDDWYTKGRGASCYHWAATSGWLVHPARPSGAWATVTALRLGQHCVHVFRQHIIPLHICNTI